MFSVSIVRGLSYKGNHGTCIPKSSQILSKLTLLLDNLVATHDSRLSLPLTKLDSLRQPIMTRVSLEHTFYSHNIPK